MDALPRAVNAKNAYATSNELSRCLEIAIPAKFISDPQYDFANDSEKHELLELINQSGNPDSLHELELVLNGILTEFATYGRSYARSIHTKSL